VTSSWSFILQLLKLPFQQHHRLHHFNTAQ